MTHETAGAVADAALLSEPQPEQPVAVREPSAPALAEATPNALLDAFMQLARDPNVRIEVLTTLAGMQERAEDRQAEREFYAAMTLAQAEMQPVIRDKDNDQTKSKYASLYAIDKIIRPIYTKYGFSPMFGTETIEGPNIRIILDLAHTGGHVKRFHFDAPPDTLGPKGSAVKTVLHGIGSTDTYLQNRLLRAAFNIVLKNDKADDDGNRGGARFITPAEAAELRALATAVGQQEGSFLDQLFAGSVRSFDEIEAGSGHLACRSTLEAMKRRNDKRAATKEAT